MSPNRALAPSCRSLQLLLTLISPSQRTYLSSKNLKFKLEDFLPILQEASGTKVAFSLSVRLAP